MTKEIEALSANLEYAHAYFRAKRKLGEDPIYDMDDLRKIAAELATLRMHAKNLQYELDWLFGHII